MCNQVYPAQYRQIGQVLIVLYKKLYEFCGFEVLELIQVKIELKTIG